MKKEQEKKISEIDKIYIIYELRKRGIDVLFEELDQLKDELVPFAKGRLEEKVANGQIRPEEKENAINMAEYFGIHIKGLY